ncbi:nucleoside-diphosphate kinase [Streptomyces smyrnaeus]|uniref:nucleoside-diphosphate kinase n=1 Tax=Streptomyces smyrnaeus TaxID=1387713 RepID=UPI0033A36406
MSERPQRLGDVVSGVDWDRWSVVLLKPDCIERGLSDTLLERLSRLVAITGRREVRVAPWQIHVHYWDLLVGADWLGRDIPACLDSLYVGKRVGVALAFGPPGTAQLLRDQLGHYDPVRAAPGTLRGDWGTDSLAQAEAEGRLINNLIHTSDDAQAACRDFGTWYGAHQAHLLRPSDVPRPASPAQRPLPRP